MDSTDELVWLFLMNADPDDVVCMLGITSEELFEAFPDKVRAYLEQETNLDE